MLGTRRVRDGKAPPSRRNAQLPLDRQLRYGAIEFRASFQRLLIMVSKYGPYMASGCAGAMYLYELTLFAHPVTPIRIA